MVANMKALLVSIVLCALSGNFAWAEEQSNSQSGIARVRFFGQAVIGLTFYKNKTCYAGKGVSASRTGFGGVFGSKKNISLGIPETPNVVNLKARDGILASAFYREYSVKAAEPLAIQGTYHESTGRIGYTCKSFGGVFTPEDGKDYEVTVDIDSQSCRLSVRRIDLIDAALQLTPVKLAESGKCSEQEPVASKDLADTPSN